jgi:hypothetical protein
VYRTSDFTKVHQQWFDNQTFTAGQQRTYPVTWSIPAGAPTGTYTVMVGVFHPGDWTPNYHWNNNAGTINVGSTGPAPVGCTPRPPVQVTSSPGDGGLQVVVRATGEGNGLQSLQFIRTTNALVDVADQRGRTGAFNISVSGAPASATFTIRRASAGAATVALGVVDRCGTWTTFVGGGPGTF